MTHRTLFRLDRVLLAVDWMFGYQLRLLLLLLLLSLLFKLSLVHWWLLAGWFVSVHPLLLFSKLCKNARPSCIIVIKATSLTHHICSLRVFFTLQQRLLNFISITQVEYRSYRSYRFIILNHFLISTFCRCCGYVTTITLHIKLIYKESSIYSHSNLISWGFGVLGFWGFGV